MGALPAVLGLVVLFIVFTVAAADTFPSPLQHRQPARSRPCSISVLAMGLVFVLLLGEIDLSAGVAGGAAAGVMAVADRPSTARPGRWPSSRRCSSASLIGLVIGLLVSPSSASRRSS